MDWTYFGQIMLIFITSAGLFTGLVGVCVKIFFDRRLEAYKIELQHREKAHELELKNKSDDYKHELDKQLESHRADLNILYSKASKLHDTRLEIIARIYRKLAALDVVMREMTQTWKQITGDKDRDNADEQERINKAADAYNGFFEYLNKNQIFFSEPLCRKMLRLRDEYFDGLWDYTWRQRWNAQDWKLDVELAQKANKKVNEDIPPILEDLRTEFRTLLGVEVN